MAPPSYLPRVQHRTRSSAFSSPLRRLASSLQCEQGGLTSVLKAPGCSTRAGARAGPAARAAPASEAASAARKVRMGNLRRALWRARSHVADLERLGQRRERVALGDELLAEVALVA